MDKDEVRRTLTQLRQIEKDILRTARQASGWLESVGRFILKGLYKMQTIRAAKLQGVGDKFFERKKIYMGKE